MKKQYMLYVKPDGQDAIKVPASRNEVAQQVREWRKSGVKVLRVGSLVPIFPPETVKCNVKPTGAVFYFPAQYL